MGADGNPGVAGKSNGRPHHSRIPGMKATRDVCRRHAAHHLGVVTKAIGTKGFADVAIEIDGRSHTVPNILGQTAQLVELATANWVKRKRDRGAKKGGKYEIVIDVTFWCAVPVPDGVDGPKTQ